MSFPLPPPPSLPENAPWTDAQKMEAYLYAILLGIQSLVSGVPITLPIPAGPTTISTTIPSAPDVLTALNSMLGILQSILATQTNAAYIQTFDVPVTVANQQLQFTTITVPDGFPLLIQSKPTNDPTGLILVAPKNGNLQFNIVALQPGQFVSYRVKSSDALYIVGTVVGDIVIFTSEVK